MALKITFLMTVITNFELNIFTGSVIKGSAVKILTCYFLGMPRV